LSRNISIFESDLNTKKVINSGKFCSYIKNKNSIQINLSGLSRDDFDENTAGFFLAQKLVQNDKKGDLLVQNDKKLPGLSF